MAEGRLPCCGHPEELEGSEALEPFLVMGGRRADLRECPRRLRPRARHPRDRPGVRPGEFLLVLGPNGAGKSTLLRTIAGFVRPQQGTIELDGKSIVRKRPETLARNGLRLVLEGHRIFPELTVEDNLEIGKLCLADRRRSTGASRRCSGSSPSSRSVAGRTPAT